MSKSTRYPLLRIFDFAFGNSGRDPKNETEIGDVVDGTWVYLVLFTATWVAGTAAGAHVFCSYSGAYSYCLCFNRALCASAGSGSDDTRRKTRRTQHCRTVA